MSRFPNDMERHAQDGTRAMQIENLKIDELFKAHIAEAFDGQPDESRDAKSYRIDDMRHAFARGWHAQTRQNEKPVDAKANGAPEALIANCDQEAWVQDRILSAMKMALSLQKERRVGADGPAFDYGLRGIAEGAAIEVIHTLGMRPAGINLRVPQPDLTTCNIANLAKL